ncbi:TonB-dependent receptor [uncultured Sphingomonas sp.]|uniref:TonB-dependent receptor n=1 Tax=uncultured Sphingomonas sp. TaxID=158754 RepID=UPI00258516A1|nr:TonB-dependent receptor [uncultured Sphingomonas sp.]
MSIMIIDGAIDRRRTGIALLGAASILALAMPAAAQEFAAAGPNPGNTQPAATSDDDAPNGDLVVTARRRNERLQDVPIAISVVGGQELGAKHLDRVADFAIKVPNFSALQQNTRVSGLFIRGLGGNASNDGAEGGVGLIVDNVVYNYVGFSWLDFVDLDSIEVARGPQGTLLGKNTTIGALIVRTQQPSFTPELNLNATYGSRNLKQIRLNATGPITDALAYRLTFSNTVDDGWITNAYDGAKYLNTNRWSARGQLLWKPAAGISSRLIGEHYETTEYNNWYPPTVDVNTNLKLDNTPFTTAANPTGARNSWSSKLKTLFGYTPSFNAPYNANLNTQGRLVSRVDGLSNEATIGIGATTLSAISAWRRMYFRPYNDSDGSPLSILRNGFDVDVDQYTQELRLASDKGGAIDWTVGAYYLHEDLRSRLRTIYYSDASAYFLSPAVPSAVLANLEVDRDGRMKVDSLAGFGQATAHLTGRFSITGGVRYTSERKAATVDGSSFGAAPLTGTLAAYTTQRAAITGSAYTLATAVRHGSWSWLVNPAWKISDSLNAYALASYGEKSGAVNTAATAAQAGVLIIQPETSQDFELGLKGRWFDGRLTVNLNLYNDTIKNYQDTQVDQSQPVLGTYLANVGKVRLRGFELETAVVPVRGWTLTFNAAHNDARYLSYDNAPAPLEYQAYLATQQGVAAAATRLSLTGYQIRNAPKWTLQGGLDVAQPVGGNAVVTGYANIAYRSRTNLANPRSIYFWQPGYALVNAGIGVRSADERWSASLWSRNLFDQRYATMFSAAGGSSPINQIFGEPRTIGFTLGRRF